MECWKDQRRSAAWLGEIYVTYSICVQVTWRPLGGRLKKEFGLSPAQVRWPRLRGKILSKSTILKKRRPF